MRREQGATEAELVALLRGCNASRAGFSCGLFGYRHVTRNVNGEVRHYAINPNVRVATRPQAAPVAVSAPISFPAATLDGLIDYANLPAAVASHMRARTAHFASRA